MTAPDIPFTKKAIFELQGSIIMYESSSGRPTVQHVILLTLTITAGFLAILTIISEQNNPQWGAFFSCLMTAVLCVSLIGARQSTWLLATPLLTLSIIIAFNDGMEAFHEGMNDALMLCGFLCALHFIRAAASESYAMKEVRCRFARLRPPDRFMAALLGSFCLGSFLHVGAHAVLAPIVSNVKSPAEHRALASVAVRGMSLAALWSPFFVGMAFVVARVPGASLGSVMAIGAVIAVTVLLSYALMSAQARGGIGPAMTIMAPAAIPAAVMLAVVVTTLLLTGWDAISTITISTPLLLMFYLLTRRTSDRESALRATLAGIVGGRDEMVIVIAAAVFSACLKGQVTALHEHLNWMAAVPGPVLLGGIIVIMIGLGVVGVHQFISASIVLSSYWAMPQLDPASFAVAVIVGWSLAAASSPVGTTIMVASRMFEVPFNRLIFWRPLAASIIIGMYSSMVIVGNSLA